jgi:hypothetical protein
MESATGNQVLKIALFATGLLKPSPENQPSETAF